MNWPRSTVTREAWQAAAARLQAGELCLLGLWGEPGLVHMAVMQSASSECSVLSLACEGDRYPSVGRLHPPAQRLERAARDLYGLEPEGLADARPWLRHGGAYPFLPAEGESLHQIPVGPVHAGIIEPGHFRFTASGETVVRLEQRLGYTHKGVESLMAGASLERAAQLAARANAREKATVLSPDTRAASCAARSSDAPAMRDSTPLCV
jgi:Respiratory-chain NADH dehydrogenase, 30 Kd subunit